MNATEYHKGWRRRNPDKVRAYTKNFRQRKSEEMRALKESRPCSLCGGTFPAECMDWDHRPGTDKQDCEALMYKTATKRVLAEIAKCDLICANCHRSRTWFRAAFLKAAKNVFGRNSN